MKTNSFIAEAQRSQRAAERAKNFFAILCVLCASAMNEFQWRFVRHGSREARWSN
jgi:hypothetical protein